MINGAMENGKITDSHDDFDIPSATATEPDNRERQEMAADAKLDGLGISSLGTMMSPNDFSQTKRSSDDLIANASETTGSPSPRVIRHEVWTNGDDTTPTGSKPASPTTPMTPTPPHRRSDSIMDVPKLREKHKDGAKEVTRNTVSQALKANLAALGSASAAANSSSPSTSHTAEPSSSESGQPNGSPMPSQRRVPTYKIALASSLLPPARRSASTAH